MKSGKSVASAALAGVLALSGAAAVDTAAAKQTERCYGIAKAGKNDCATATNACAGAVKKDNDPNAWVNVDKGRCEQLGGKLQPPKKG